MIFDDKTHTGCRVFSSTPKKVFTVLAGITSLLLQGLGAPPGKSISEAISARSGTGFWRIRGILIQTESPKWVSEAEVESG